MISSWFENEQIMTKLFLVTLECLEVLESVSDSLISDAINQYNFFGPGTRVIIAKAQMLF